MRWLTRTSQRAGKPAGKGASPFRRRGAARRLRPLLRATAIAAGVAGAVAGPAWLWHSGWIDGAAQQGYRALIAWTADIGLAVQEVSLEGRIHTPRRRIMAAVGLKRGTPMFAFDPDDIRARLTALPWVRDASVQRQAPGTVRIRITERAPLALWQRKGKLTLVDEQGQIITRRKLHRFRNLLIIVGDDAPSHAAHLIAMLGREAALARRVNAAIRVGKRRWNLELKNGIKVRLPETDPEAAWRKLARLDRRQRLLSREVKTVDLRQPDRLIVVPSSKARPVRVKSRQRKSGRST